MSGRTPPIYRRGKYWLDWDRRADGTLRSPNLTIFWYDPDARRVRSASTGTPAQDQAILSLDRRYLADTSEAAAFCHACGQPLARANAYLLTDAIADYRIEWGDRQRSGDSIKARLDHILDFLDAETARGTEARFGIGTSCATACGTVFIEAFRDWSRRQPVTWKNAKGEVTASKPRAPATTEESVSQLAAALNHAARADPPRSDKRPTWRPHPRKQVSRPRRTRTTVETIAQMLAYAAEPAKRRGSLHGFLVGSICTMARPDAVLDISVAPDRQQWAPGATMIDLNPQGRSQTKKFRPVLPVLPIFDEWLTAEHADYMALSPRERIDRGWLVNYYGRPVKDVDSAWTAMLRALDLPAGREWRPYILRHSLATIVRNRGANRWDLEGYLGHRAPSQTEVYAIGEFPTVTQALSEIIKEIEELSPGALHRNPTGRAASLPKEGRRLMP